MGVGGGVNTEQLRMTADVDLWHSYVHTHEPLHTQTCTYIHKLELHEKGQLPVHQKQVLSRHRRVSEKKLALILSLFHWLNEESYNVLGGDTASCGKSLDTFTIACRGVT